MEIYSHRLRLKFKINMQEIVPMQLSVYLVCFGSPGLNGSEEVWKKGAAV